MPKFLNPNPNWEMGSVCEQQMSATVQCSYATPSLTPSTRCAAPQVMQITRWKAEVFGVRHAARQLPAGMLARVLPGS